MAGASLCTRRPAVCATAFYLEGIAAALVDELKAAADRGEPDDGSHYYHHWLAAFERLVTEEHLSDQAAMLARKEAWAEAYRRTPHGKPVKLPNPSN